MKRWIALCVALLMVVLAVTPAFAQGPYVGNSYRLAQWPFGVLNGMVFGIAHSILTAIALAALGALVVVFLPSQARLVSETAQKSVLPSLGVGCLTALVALPLFVLLVVLVITIPAALVLPVALTVAWLFGWIALGWLVGEKVLQALQARESLRVPMVAVALGVLLLAMLGAVPVIGWLVGLGVGLVGLGAVILTRFGTHPYPSQVPASNP